MPAHANVFINYGPYKSNGVVDYREDRLVGLKTYLEANGHKVIEFTKTSCWNNVEIIVNNELVFKCNIKDLDFGGDGELDELAVKAENAVKNAY